MASSGVLSESGIEMELEGGFQNEFYYNRKRGTPWCRRVTHMDYEQLK